MSSNTNPPPLFRLLLLFGGPFGLYYIPESCVRLIRRMEQYDRIERGPGFMRYNPFTETLGPQFKVGVEPFAYLFDGLPASDGLQIGLKLNLNYEFFPEKVGRLTTVAKLGQLSKEVFCEIVSNRVRRALLSIIPTYTAETVCRGQVFDNIEQQTVANTNQLLAPLGMEISGLLILQVTPPETLRARLEGVAGRRLSVEALREYQSTDVNRALAAEFIEGLAGRTSGDQYLDVGGMLGSVGGPPDSGGDPERKSFLSPPRKR